MDRALIDETDAIAGACRGDTAAFGVLVERHQQVAFRAAYLVLHDSAAAEDAAQEAFIRAFRKIHTFRQGESFRPWLVRIVQHQALNELRSRGRRSGLLGRVARVTTFSVEPPHADVAAGSDASTLLRAIGELPQDDRVILHLRYFLELPEREIAAAIGKPAGTVKSRLHRAGKRLRELIETKYPQLRDRTDG